MRKLTEFHSRLIPLVPGCPEPLANQAILDAAIAFCEDSLALRESLDAFDTVAGESGYDLWVPSHLQVARVMEVSVNGTPLRVASFDMVGGLADTSGTPQVCYTTRTGSDFQLCLYPVPDGVYSVSVEAAVRPKRDAAWLEDDLFDVYAEAIVAGAVSRIAVIPSQPFSDPSMAAWGGSRAVHLSSKARVESSHGRVRGALRVQPRPFV